MGLRVVGIMSHDDLLEESISREPQLPLKQPTSRTPLELLKARLQSMKEYRGGAPAKPQQRFQPASLASFYEIAGNMLTHITFLELRSSLKGRGFAAETTLVHIPDGTSSLPLRVSHPLVRSCTFRLIGKLQITAVSAFHVDICFAGVPFQKNNGLATCTLSYDASLPTELIVDAFAFDWSATMNLLRITRRFNAFLESQLTPGGLKYDVEYNMKSLKIFYGPELELAMFISWDRSNHKMLMDFYCRTGNAWNPHRQMRTKLLELLTSEQSHEMHLVEFAKIFEIIGNTTPLVLGVRDSIRPVGVVKDPRLLHPQTAFQFLPVSLSNYVVSWKGTYYVYIRVLAGPKFILTDLGGTEIVRKSDDVKYMPIPGFRILLEEVTGQRFPKWKTEMGYGNVTLEESIGGLDPEVQYSLVRFFTRFKGYHVQLTGASYGI